MALCNAGYIDLLLNWKASVDRLNISHYIIVPNDLKAAQQLSFLGVSWTYDPDIGLDDDSSEAAAYTNDKKSPMWKKWNKVVHKKAAYVRKLLSMGLDVLVTDVDLVFMKDPTPLFADKRVDLFFINDVQTVPPPADREVLLCGGFWLGRSNDRTLSFVNFVQECEKTGMKEQPCFEQWRNSTRAGHAHVHMKVLSTEDFPSGAHYFNTFWMVDIFGQPLKVKPDPYIVHNNWIVGHSQKLARFRKHGLLWVRVDVLTEVMARFRFHKHLKTHDELLALHNHEAHDPRTRRRLASVVSASEPIEPQEGDFDTLFGFDRFLVLQVLLWYCPLIVVGVPTLLALVWIRQRGSSFFSLRRRWAPLPLQMSLGGLPLWLRRP